MKPSDVAISEAYRRAAERFRRYFVHVPLTEAEKMPDPEYGEIQQRTDPERPAQTRALAPLTEESLRELFSDDVLGQAMIVSDDAGRDAFYAARAVGCSHAEARQHMTVAVIAQLREVIIGALDAQRREVSTLREALAVVTRERNELLALLPVPPEHVEKLAWVRLLIEKGLFMPAIQDSLETQKSNAPTWQGAIMDRLYVLKEERDSWRRVAERLETEKQARDQAGRQERGE